MKTIRYFSLILMIAMLLLGIAVATGETVTFDPATVTIARGGSTGITISMNEAPSGLAGYEMVIRLSNPGIAKISDVAYPPWAVLFNTTRNSDGSVRISGVDLSRQVNAGMTGIPLATITVTGVSGGTSSIMMEAVSLDADGGAMITPDLAIGQIYVPGGSVVPSGGGGGGDSSSYQPTQTQASSTPIPSPTVTLVQPTGTASPVFTTDTPQPTATFTSEPRQAEVSATLEMPETGGGIPWTWAIGGVIVLAALFIGAFIAWRREEEQ
jgi:hypothetical protein